MHISDLKITAVQLIILLCGLYIVKELESLLNYKNNTKNLNNELFHCFNRRNFISRITKRDSIIYIDTTII